MPTGAEQTQHAKLVDWMVKYQFDEECDYFTIDPVAYAAALGAAWHGVLPRQARRPLGGRRSAATRGPTVLDAVIRTSARDRRVAAWLQDTAAARTPRRPSAGRMTNPAWEFTGILFPMEATVDSVGRVVIPKVLRDALGLRPGSTVDISPYGAGLQLLPTGRTARLIHESGVLVATGETQIDDDVFGLIDAGRR